MILQVSNIELLLFEAYSLPASVRTFRHPRLECIAVPLRAIQELQLCVRKKFKELILTSEVNTQANDQGNFYE